MHTDEEWLKYLQSQTNGGLDADKYMITAHSTHGQALAKHGLESDDSEPDIESNIKDNSDIVPTKDTLSPPVFEDLYISTKTKVLYLNQEIDIHRIFWLIPIIEYWRPVEGVVKKQMKIVSKTKEEFEEYQQKLQGNYYYKDHIVKQIDNPNARRIKFKDERKITIGISKKDIMNYKSKQKNAFYNCFAIIIRFMFKGEYKEIHVKVFNTGKLEIPGVLNNELLTIVKQMILEIVQPHVETSLEYVDMNRNDENVLINSNFNCGFYINRDRLHSILRSEKYRIESAYDPCSYPGVKCKFYFNNEVVYDADLQKGQIMVSDRSMKMNELIDSKKYTEISFMIFRTGSCLIVGNCTEKILMFVYEFIKQILIAEYPLIHVVNEDPVAKTKKTKDRKKTIHVTEDYLRDTILKKSAVGVATANPKINL
jgi:hypothetical protein